MNDLKNKILDSVKDDLMAIENALVENLTPHVELVREVAGHILFAGGKRLRPLLMVLSARLCGYDGDYDKTFSTIFEYLHAATLLHDDLVDEAAVRRGKPVANSIFGNSTAILTGDFLLARGLSIAARTGIPEVIDVIAKITEDMSQGEIFQLDRKGDPQLTEEEYLEIIRCKTAVLFEGACRISALIADAPEEKKDALSRYGFHLGMAFQMADDLLDYTSESENLGKEIGADLREGKLTLPVIHTLKNAEDGDRRWIVKNMQDPDFTPGTFARLVKLLENCGGIEYTRKYAEYHIRNAKEALGAFPLSDTRDILMNVADYALVRDV